MNWPTTLVSVLDLHRHTTSTHTSHMYIMKVYTSRIHRPRSPITSPLPNILLILVDPGEPKLKFLHWFIGFFWLTQDCKDCISWQGDTTVMNVPVHRTYGCQGRIWGPLFLVVYYVVFWLQLFPSLAGTLLHFMTLTDVEETPLIIQSRT